MGINRVSIETVSCDMCNVNIASDTQFIDATNYGAVLCQYCGEEHKEFAKMLNLDDIYLRYADDDTKDQKWIYS